jgi:Sec-independent protein secretion pathway component TatC
MTRLILVVVAVVIIVVGAIVLPMPIPLGAIMMLTGMTILISQSPFVARRVREFRRRNLSLNQVIGRVERYLPEKVREILRRTDP